MAQQSTGPESGNPSTPDKISLRPGESRDIAAGTIVIRVESAGPGRRSVLSRWGVSLLFASILLNVWFLLSGSTAYSPPAIPEIHFSGDKGAEERIAIINFTGTISPPFTERWLRQIEQAAKDDTVKGVVMAIDSPGGFVADSHQLYRELKELSANKPVYVAMKRIAASGGYYIAMGIGDKGRIFAEPTTWTGSIGVIIPRYNATELAKTVGLKVEPLVTGELKDTLNPFRDMGEKEKVVWDAIMKDSFDRFIGVIDDNRTLLDDSAVRTLATGQIYTARQALDHHLVDEIGYVEDSVEALAKSLQLTSYAAFEYKSTPGLIDALMGSRTETPSSIVETVMESTVPRAMYYCSWNPWVPIR